MSDPALDYVHDVLRAYSGRGIKMRGSVEALGRLVATRSSVTTAAVVPESRGASRPVSPAPEPRKSPAATSSADATPVSKSHGPTKITVMDDSQPRLAPLTGTNAERLEAMRGPVLACEKCPNLVASRTQVVFGVGNPDAELLLVGEAPGEDEDLQGEPFVGKAGQLLTKIIETMGFARSDVFIANILKCRPDMPSGTSGNRKPRADEMATCFPYLREQIDIVRPKVLVALGATAMEGLTGQTLPMAKLRGRWHDFGGIPLMATYHPAYLLRNQSLGEKRKVWEDMLLVLEELRKPISEKQRNYFLPK